MSIDSTLTPPENNDLTEVIIGAAIAVHRELGAGFAEITYQRALMIELANRGLAFECEVPVQLRYAGQVIGEGRMDLVVEGAVVVELKACEANPKRFVRQVVSYLKASGHDIGLVINFEHDRLVDGVARVRAPKPTLCLRDSVNSVITPPASSTPEHHD